MFSLLNIGVAVTMAFSSINATPTMSHSVAYSRVYDISSDSSKSKSVIFTDTWYKLSSFTEIDFFDIYSVIPTFSASTGALSYEYTSQLVCDYYHLTTYNNYSHIRANNTPDLFYNVSNVGLQTHQGQLQLIVQHYLNNSFTTQVIDCSTDDYIHLYSSNNTYGALIYNTAKSLSNVSSLYGYSNLGLNTNFISSNVYQYADNLLYSYALPIVNNYRSYSDQPSLTFTYPIIPQLYVNNSIVVNSYSFFVNVIDSNTFQFGFGIPNSTIGFTNAFVSYAYRSSNSFRFISFKNLYQINNKYLTGYGTFSYDSSHTLTSLSQTSINDCFIRPEENLTFDSTNYGNFVSYNPLIVNGVNYTLCDDGFSNILNCFSYYSSYVSSNGSTGVGSNTDTGVPTVTDSQSTPIVEVIYAIADTPVIIVKGLLGWDLWGFNLFGVFASAFTLVLTIWVIKKVF